MFWLCRSLCSSLNCSTVWSFTSGLEICSRMLSVDQLISPENISVRIRATTGTTLEQENWSEWIQMEQLLLPDRQLTWTMISFLSLGFLSGQSSPKQK